MNREEIMSMSPGRELDALVAEKVMGWNWGIIGDLIPAYSTDISAVWEIFEGIDGLYAFEVGRPGDYYAPDDKWRARFGMNWAEGDTAPEAICKAALLAICVEDAIDATENA